MIIIFIKFQISKLTNDAKNFLTILFHKNVANAQRQAYSNHKTVEYLGRDKIVIEADFKQKIKIGLSPRQISSEYYEQQERSCLGFGVYFVNDENIIECINFDVISFDNKQTGFAAIRGFRFLRTQQFFEKFQNIKQYIVWLDCGKHFRNKMLIGYLFKELAADQIHGKIFKNNKF